MGRSRKREKKTNTTGILLVAGLLVVFLFAGGWALHGLNRTGQGSLPGNAEDREASELAEKKEDSPGGKDIDRSGAELPSGEKPADAAGWVEAAGEDFEIKIVTGTAVTENPDAGTGMAVTGDQEGGTGMAATGDQEGGTGMTATGDQGNGTGLAAEDDLTLRLSFAGDILLSDYVLDAYDAGGLRGILGESLEQEIWRTDFFMANEEFPFSTRGKQAEDKQYTFRLPPERVGILKELGLDLVTLANNHALDFGEDALLDTFATLDKAGLPYVGAGANRQRAAAMYETEIKGTTVGFLAATRVMPDWSWVAGASSPGMFSAYDPEDLLAAIRKGKDSTDYLVVYLHWGVEKAEQPKDYQRSLGKQCIDAGADLVIGAHPHVLQGIEYYKGKPIVYSLGNFIFSNQTRQTMLLTAAYDGSATTLTLHPATSGAGRVKAITDPEKKKELLAHVQELSFGVTIGEDGVVTP